jgi:drug/metabolite transporter (DMT)-like permease
VASLRFLAGGAVLVPFALRRPAGVPPAVEARAVGWCSAALLAGYLFLTVGLQTTTSTAAAFITYLLVVIVPLLSAVLLRRPPPAPVAAGAVLATAGLFLLAGEGLRLGAGEALVLGCAFAFAVHILLVGRFAGGLDPVRFTAFQLLAVGAGAALPAVGRAELWDVGAGALVACGALAAAGVAGLLLQVAGQRTVGPARTSLLLMLEPVLAALGGYVIGERLPPLGFVGAACILGGILLSEVPLDPRVSRPG